MQAADLLAGWTDVEGDTLSISGLSADHGSVVDHGDGSYTVQPDDDYHGAVTLSYLIGDGINTAAAALSFNLAAVNDAPELTGTPAILSDGTEDTDYTVQAAGLLTGWSDVEGDTLSISNLSADHGNVVDHGDGSYTVQPEAGYHGTVTLNYLVGDGTGTTAATLGFNLAHVNHSPVLAAPVVDQAVQYGTLDWNYNAGILFSDQDITDSLNYSATLANGDPLPAWIQIGAASGLIAGVPEFSDRGIYALSIMATDSYGSSISAPLTIAVTVFDAGRLLVSTMGDDLLAGTLSNDTASYAYSNAPVFVSLAISAPQDTVGGGLDTLSDVDNLMGSDFNDKLTGNTGANILDGGGGADQLIGGGGDDTYVVDDASDVVTETGTGGTDTILTWVNFANLAFGVEKLTLLGSGNINANGNVSDNILTGNSGDNILNGKSGADTMIGGVGDDTYMVENINDIVIEHLDEAEGIDTVQSYITYTLSDSVENIKLMASLAIDATGNNLSNILNGNIGANVLSGMSGNDTLNGNGGDDALNGGEGNDTLVGGQGADLLNGGTGADIFRLKAVAESGAGAGSRDIIEDFNSSETDRINLSLIDADPSTSTNDAFSWKGTGSFSGVAGELRYFNENTYVVAEGDITGDGVADFQIEIMGVNDLLAQDFVL